MFVAYEVTVDASLEVAAAGRSACGTRDALSCASEAAYEGGLWAVLRIGPFGQQRGLSKLVRVCCLEPALCTIY